MHTLTRTLLACGLALAATFAARAQERYFAIVDYMHIPDSSSEAEYLALEKLWQRIHQKAVDSGASLGWTVYRVENGGRNQFVTLQVYDSPARVFDPWSGDLSALIKQLYNAEEAAKMNKTDEVRVLTRSELWRLESAAMGPQAGEPAGHNILNFMKVPPGKLEAYVQMESSVFRKAHQARVDGGEMKGWYFLSRWFPAGADGEYDYVTVDAYADKAASEKAPDMKRIEAVLSKEEMAGAEKVEGLRTVVRREVWTPVLRTTPRR